MASYILSRFDGTAPNFTVPDQSIDTTQSPLNLVGRGSVSYGVATAENFIHLCEHFASANNGSNFPNPNIVNPLTGMLWFDKTTNRMRTNSGTPGSPVWDVVGKPMSNTVAPSPASTGDLWYDVNDGVLKVFNGTAWVVVGPFALTGDVTAVINNTTGSVALSLVTQGGVTPGTYSSVTVNAKGLIIGASNLSPLTLTGAVTGTASGSSIATTLADSGVVAGNYLATNLSVNSKGIVTSATTATSISVSGAITAGTNLIFSGANIVGTNAIGVRTVSTSTPSGGAENDIWYQY